MRPLNSALGLMKKHQRQLLGALIGSAITPLAIGAAIASAGAGHGNYMLAKLLFPYSLFLSRFAGDTISFPLICLAFAQFPLYGLAVTSFNATRAVGALTVSHAIGASLCFFGLLPVFS